MNMILIRIVNVKHNSKSEAQDALTANVFSTRVATG